MIVSSTIMKDLLKKIYLNNNDMYCVADLSLKSQRLIDTLNFTYKEFCYIYEKIENFLLNGVSSRNIIKGLTEQEKIYFKLYDIDPEEAMKFSMRYNGVRIFVVDKDIEVPYKILTYRRMDYDKYDVVYTIIIGKDFNIEDDIVCFIVDLYDTFIMNKFNDIAPVNLVYFVIPDLQFYTIEPYRLLVSYYASLFKVIINFTNRNIISNFDTFLNIFNDHIVDFPIIGNKDIMRDIWSYAYKDYNGEATESERIDVIIKFMSEYDVESGEILC